MRTQPLCLFLTGSVMTTSDLNSLYLFEKMAPFFKTVCGSTKFTPSRITGQVLATAIVVSRGGKGDCSKFVKTGTDAVARVVTVIAHPDGMKVALTSELAASVRHLC